MPVPTVSPALSGIDGLSGGKAHVCGARNQSVLCWGANESGQLGRGTIADDAFPDYVSFLAPTMVHVASGSAHSCATNAQEAYCWGANDYGQLGNDDPTAASTPVVVDGLAGNVARLGAGQSHTCAILANSQVQCWGRGNSGQLGNFAFDDSWMPVTVVYESGMFNIPVTGAQIVDAGRAHSCAVVLTGVKCWGVNDYGQLGDGTNVFSSRGVSVVGLVGGVLGLAAGDDFNCATSSDNKVRCWGLNGGGQLGDGTNTNRPLPIVVHTDAQNELTGATAVAASDYHACALRNDGSVWCWGFNLYGQLGTGTFENSSYAVQVLLPPNSGVTGLTAGEYFTCASSPTQTWCWGNGYRGRLGNGELGYSIQPRIVEWLFQDGFE